VMENIWLVNDFEEEPYHAGMFAVSGATNSIIEWDPPLYSQGQPDAGIVYVEPTVEYSTVGFRMRPTRKEEIAVLGSLALTHHLHSPQNLFNSIRYSNELFNQSGIVLSRALIDDLARSLQLWGSLSASYSDLPREDEYPQLEAVHPLTSSAYDQLAVIPTPTKEAIQNVLNLFANFVSYTVTAGLPSLRLTLLEDSSYLLEWTFEDRRLGFSFEKDPRDSGWYFVLFATLSERSESGTMDQLEMGRLIKMMLNR